MAQQSTVRRVRVLEQFLNLDLNVLLLGSYTDRKAGLSGANYVGENLPFSVSNAHLPGETVQCNCHRTALSPWKAQLSLYKHQATFLSLMTSPQELEHF